MTRILSDAKALSPGQETTDCGRDRMREGSVGGDKPIGLQVKSQYAESPAQENNSSANGFQPNAQTVSAQIP